MFWDLVEYKRLLSDTGKPTDAILTVSEMLTEASSIIGVPAVVFLDQALDAVRMVRPAAYVLTDKSSLATTTPGSIRANVESAETLSTSPSRGSDTEAQAAVVKAGKVPRPPNAFILYRQHHHPLVKRASPHLHNNEICKSTSTGWKTQVDLH